MATALGLIVVSTALCLVAGEIFVFRIFLDPANFLEATLIDDPILGHRIAPYSTGHDALGFRNKSVPERADIVAIGDSQTYGVRATREGSWPHQLAAMLGESVYDMGMPGYGPVDYLYVLREEAPRLHPKQLVVGFYFGNDLLDACWAVTQRAYWASWRRAGPDICPPYAEPRKRFGALRDWLAGHSVLYGAAKMALERLIARMKSYDASSAARDEEMVWLDPAEPSVRTIFTPAGRHGVVDPKLPAVQEGLRITERAFAEMREAAARQGAHLLVVLIPTKEHAYCAYLEQTKTALPPEYAGLCRDEGLVEEDLSAYLASAGIAHVDALGPMQKAVADHVQIYPADENGHPLAAGYAVIARTVRDALANPQPE
ncbi:MAG TPA: SGNH/GDSL hydrolase family protein [Stellaceae bacterium]|nr:SGNH/GDSL hydrolase family protein [Stellaceae bacterium]